LKNERWPELGHKHQKINVININIRRFLISVLNAGSKSQRGGPL
jgi:hypothetical protein